MNIFVCIKEVPDTEASLQVKDGKSINNEGLKWIISPYDEYAIEEALKLKEKLGDSTVTVISVGSERIVETIRKGLAMGAEKAIHVHAENTLDNKIVAKALSEAIKKQDDYGIIFMGKQAIDDDAYLTHIYLANYLNIPVATNVIKFEYNDNKAIVEREIEEGAREKIEMNVPCVVAATKGLNEPRYPSIMGMMKAKKVQIEKYELSDIGIDDNNKVEVEKLYFPPEKPEGKVLEGELEDVVKELVRLLKDEAKVL